MKLRVLAFSVLVVYLLYASAMFINQEQILFPGSSDKHYPLIVQDPLIGRLVEIPASFGNVRMFYQPAPPSTKQGPSIFYTHGNFECIQDSFALMHPLVDAGISVLQLEFPGFCGADGNPSFANILEAEELAYDWLANKPEVDKSRIIAMGYSIGGGTVGELTRHRSVGGLILLSTFTSISDMAHRYLLPNFLVRYPFDNLRRLQEFSGPVFLEHGKQDHVIPFAMGQELTKSRPGSEFIALDCGHNDCHFDRNIFLDRIPAWLVANSLLVSAAKH